MSVQEIMICSRRSYFDDDLVSICLRCCGLIYLRPHSQRFRERVCDACGQDLMRGERETPRVHMTQESVIDVRRYLLGGTA